jgi:hypothetical protein
MREHSIKKLLIGHFKGECSNREASPGGVECALEGEDAFAAASRCKP